MSDHINIIDRDGLQAFWQSTPYFKTARISMRFALPLTSSRDAAGCAMVSNLLTRVTRSCPDYTVFGRRLQELYGASVSSGLRRSGDNQILTFATGSIANRYTFDGEDIQRAMADMLEEIVFEPLLAEDGLFPEDGFEQERRQLLETIDAEFNEKRSYALKRCRGIMLEGDPSGIPLYGSREDVVNVTREDAKKAWENAIKHGQAFQFTIGDGADGRFAESFAERLGRRDVYEFSTKPHVTSGEVKRIMEEMPLAQSKLVLGFSVSAGKEDFLATKLMSVILGGTPSSKLFLNVREKQSLCYYCMARLEAQKGIMLIDCGVETSNLERAEEAILAELSAMQRGEITDEEIDNTRLAMFSAYISVTDSASGIENWYLSGMIDNEIVTPEERIEQLRRITRDDIVAAAKKVRLDTVYRLKGVSAGEQ